MVEDLNKQAGKVIEAVTAIQAQANREANSLKIRLETESIKEKISSFLNGMSKGYFRNTKGDIEITNIESGVRKVNDVGYQFIMSHVEAIVNKSTVMGNFQQTSDLYGYLSRAREAFAWDLWENMTSYGIKESEFLGLIGNIYALIEPFMTRTIGDGERATIRDTTVQHDRVISGEDKGFSIMRMFK
jgi:hypothetical protein